MDTNLHYNKEELLEGHIFCMSPWIHLHNFPDGRVFPCCLTPQEQPVGSLKENTLSEIWNSDGMKQLRLNMLNGVPSQACNKCYEQEGKGFWNLRRMFNHKFSSHVDLIDATSEDGSCSVMKILYFDFRFSNLCNFKCRMCGPQLSSSWYDEHLQLTKGFPAVSSKVIQPKENIEDFWQQVKPHLEHVEEVYFAGGEPLIMEEHYRILKALIEKKRTNVLIRYTTNLSTLKYKDHDIFSLWKKFERVEVGASIDAIGARLEYIRKGAKWSNILDNVKRIVSESDRTHLSLMPTLNFYNAYHIVDLYWYFVNNSYIDPSQFNFNVLTDPSFFRIQRLPMKHREAVAKLYRKAINEISVRYGAQANIPIEGFKSMVELLETSPIEELDIFVRKTIELDQLRGERFPEVFPEFKGLVND